MINSPKAEGQKLVITRVFDAPRELVFKAWTEPEHLKQWWGPNEFTTPVCELDVRPGGAMLIHMMAPDGSVFAGKGTFREVVPPERLVFTSIAFEDAEGEPALEVLHTITFAEDHGKTKLTLEAVVIKVMPEVSEALSGMAQGWTESLAKLAATIAAIRQR